VNVAKSTGRKTAGRCRAQSRRRPPIFLLSAVPFLPFTEFLRYRDSGKTPQAVPAEALGGPRLGMTSPRATSTGLHPHGGYSHGLELALYSSYKTGQLRAPAGSAPLVGSKGPAGGRRKCGT